MAARVKFKEMTWEEFDKNCESISRSTLAHMLDDTEARIARVKRALQDYEFFVMTYFPHYAKFKCAAWHIKLATKCARDRTFKGIVEGHRGSAKSVHATLLIPLWLKFKKELKCMVLVGETLIKAQRLLAALQAELQSNQLLIADFGEQISKGDWEKGEFLTADNEAFYALSLGTDPSGTRNGPFRPDYIVVDDVDSKKRCKNPRLVREAIEWIQEELMGCFDIGRERFLLVNSTKAKVSILEGIKTMMIMGKVPSFMTEEDEHGEEETKSNVTATTSQSWTYFHVPALDEKGQPTWPEKYTRAYWLAKQSSLTLRAWMLNYQCQVVQIGKEFKEEWIKWAPARPLDEYDQLIVYCDPAWKSTPTACYKAIKFWGRRGTKLDQIKAYVRRSTVSSMVRYFYDLYEAIEMPDLNTGPFKFKRNKPVTCTYMMESNMLQELLLDEFTEEGDRRGYQLPIMGDNRSKPDKISRIVAKSALYERGFITYNEDEKEDPDMQRAVEHLLAVEEGGNSPLDSPDADEGAIWQLQRTGRQRKYEIRTGARTHKNAY